MKAQPSILNDIERFFVAILLLLILIVLLSIFAVGLQGAPCATCTVVKEEDAYRWVEWKDDPNRLYLYRGNEQVGAYDMDQCYYRSYRNSTWGDCQEPPIAPPSIAQGPNNQGVEVSKIAKVETYRFNGAKVEKAKAFQQLQKAELPDDKDKLRLTIIGSLDDRKKVLTDLQQHPELSNIAQAVVVQDYAPDDWAVNGVGFVTSGTPTIYLQEPSGKVLFRSDHYTGPEAIVQAIRKPNPNYKPSLDPSNLLPSLPSIPPFAWVVALLGVVALFHHFQSKKG